MEIRKIQMRFAGVIRRKAKGIACGRAFKLKGDHFNDMLDGVGMGVARANNGKLSRRARYNKPFSVGQVIGPGSVIGGANNGSTELLDGGAILAEERYLPCHGPMRHLPWNRRAREVGRRDGFLECRMPSQSLQVGYTVVDFPKQ